MESTERRFQMACSECEHIDRSFDGNPFIPPGGSVMDITYICPICRQKWWCYNNYYHLWTVVDDEATWQNILRGCPSPVSIGSPAENVYQKQEPDEVEQEWGLVRHPEPDGEPRYSTGRIDYDDEW